ncbi:MAG: DUF4136 domain-containing protein [Kiritimatiellales bacterium]|nr:DUF4136 domain-containing protein [Kiritimatiellales bacterium]
MKTKLSIVLAALLLAGCSSVLVRHDYEPSTDFSALKTYAWKHDVQPETGDVRADNDLLNQRIRHAVNHTLPLKGFNAVAREQADFLVDYHVTYQRRLDSSTFTVGIGGGRGGRYGSVNTGSNISDYEEATLTIDILDRGNGDKLMWRGTGSRRSYMGSNPETSIRIVNDAVGRMLAKFPPQK